MTEIKVPQSGAIEDSSIKQTVRLSWNLWKRLRNFCTHTRASQQEVLVCAVTEFLDKKELTSEPGGKDITPMDYAS